MTPTAINTHIEDAKKRLVEQYKEKPNLAGIIDAESRQYQDMEDVINDMLLNQSQFVDNAVGEQLDLFGTIVDQDRQGFDDDFYRILLKFKIGQNISRGEPERIISTMLLIVQAGLVIYQNLGNGNIGLSIDTTIDPSLLNFIFTNMQRVVTAGVRINFIATFDPDESFSFDGIGPIGLGFSSLAAPLTGGKLAFLNTDTTNKFAFDSIAGIESSDLGFGTLADPLAGGAMLGL